MRVENQMSHMSLSRENNDDLKKACDKGDVDQFCALMGALEEDKNQQDKSDSKISNCTLSSSNEMDSVGCSMSGDAILAQLSRTGSNELQSTPRTSQTAAMDEVCQQILVSDPENSGDSEIRLQIKQDILPDTEIRLKLSEGGLQVQLMTQHANSAQTLVAGQFDLQQRLEKSLDMAVTVEVQNQETGQDTAQREAATKIDYELE